MWGNVRKIERRLVITIRDEQKCHNICHSIDAFECLFFSFDLFHHFDFFNSFLPLFNSCFLLNLHFSLIESFSWIISFHPWFIRFLIVVFDLTQLHGYVLVYSSDDKNPVFHSLEPQTQRSDNNTLDKVTPVRNISILTKISKCAHFVSISWFLSTKILLPFMVTAIWSISYYMKLYERSEEIL